MACSCGAVKKSNSVKQVTKKRMSLARYKSSMNSSNTGRKIIRRSTN